MRDEKIRLEALKQAINMYQKGDRQDSATGDRVTEVARQFYDFLAEKGWPATQADASKSTPPLPKGT